MMKPQASVASAQDVEDAPWSAAPAGVSLARWACVAAAVAAMLILPFLMVDTPAVLDYPNHLARLYILAHPRDSALSEMYAPHWAILPNLGVDVLGAALLRVASPSVGGRLLLVLSLLAPVAGVAVYHRIVFRRLAYWPLASAVAAYNGVFFLGFMNFLLAIGLGLMAAGGWIGLRRGGGFWRAGVFGAAASALLFFCHIFGVAFFALLVGCWELSRLDEARRAGTLQPTGFARTAAITALALAPAAALYLASPMASPAGRGAWEGAWKLWGIFTPFMIYSRPLTVLTGAAVFATVIFAWRSARFGPGVRAALALLAVLYVAAPAKVQGGTFVDTRLALMFGLLLFAGLDPRPSSRRAAGLVTVAFVALFLVRTASVAGAWVDHRRDLADLRVAIAPVAPGARVLVARSEPGAPIEMKPAGRAIPGLAWLDGNLGSLLVIERHAFWPLQFADPNQQPLVVSAPYRDIAARPLDEMADWRDLRPAAPTAQALASAAYLKQWRARFDYVLLLDADKADGPTPGLAPVRLTPYAALYRIQRPGGAALPPRQGADDLRPAW